MRANWHESPSRCRIAAVLLGATSVGAFAPFGGFFLAWLTLGGLYLLLGYGHGRVREGALVGGLF
ncbi:MAG: hypothetical protein LBI62_00780, partial [Candidatus Accumulibacter sp.]|nr:hypothetical protein [Accumulibacter sp.]